MGGEAAEFGHMNQEDTLVGAQEAIGFEVIIFVHDGFTFRLIELDGADDLHEHGHLSRKFGRRGRIAEEK